MAFRSTMSMGTASPTSSTSIRTAMHIATQTWEAATQTFSFVTSSVVIPSFQLQCTSKTYDPSQVSVHFGDMNAAGVDDIVVFACGYMTWFDVAGGTRPNLLQTISNGAGAVTTLAYDNIKNLPSITTSVPVPVEVVTTVTTTNGLSGPYAMNGSVTYTYDSPVYDAREREFVGFKNVTTTTQSDMGSPGVDATTHFATTTCAVSPGKPCPPSADYPYRLTRGVPAVVEQKDNSRSDATLTTTVHSYVHSLLYPGADGRVVHQMFQSQWDEYLWDPLQQQQSALATTSVIEGPPAAGGLSVSIAYALPAAASHLKRSFGVDGLGNPTTVVDYGWVGTDTPILSSTSLAAAQRRLDGLELPAEVRPDGLTADTSLNQLPPVREVDFAYDWRGLVTSVASPLTGTQALQRFNPYGSIALPPANASQDSAPGTPRVLLSLAYDSFGNLQQIQQPGTGRCAGIGYDPLYNQLPTQTQRVPGRLRTSSARRRRACTTAAWSASRPRSRQQTGWSRRCTTPSDG